MAFITFVRVQDAFGQYDHPKGVDLPEGATLVEDYPEHVGLLARPSKAFVGKDGAPANRDSDSYDQLTKPKLVAELEKRTKAGRDIAATPSDTKPAIVAALEADDTKQAEVDAVTSSDTTDVSDTGDHTNTSGDAAGSE